MAITRSSSKSMAAKPKKMAAWMSKLRSVMKKIIRKTKTPLPSSSPPESPIRAIVVVNDIRDMRHVEETEDCFILGFDPFDSMPQPQLLSDSAPAINDDEADISDIAEKGQVPHRDYPHSRHICLKFPFETTNHESYCEKCYCYVCGSVAPCKYWTLERHCNAEDVDYWQDQRSRTRGRLSRNYPMKRKLVFSP